MSCIHPCRLMMFAGVIFLLFGGVKAASGQAVANEGMLRYVPSAANSIVMIDVAQLHNSALGRELDWPARHADDFYSGAVPYPPNTHAVVFADQLDPRDWRTVEWEVGVVLLTEQPSMEEIAAHQRGTITTHGDRRIVVTPRNTFITRLGDRMVGSYHPANRQEFIRWLRRSEHPSSPELSKFLADSASYWRRHGQLVAALDQADSIDMEVIRQELQLHPDFKDAENLDGLARGLASITGMRLIVNVTDKITAQLHVLFDESIDPIRDDLRGLLEWNVAEHVGGSLHIRSWPMEIADHAVVFEQTLEPEQFRELLADLQPSVARSLPIASSDSPRFESQAEATKEYFTRGVRMLNSLDRRTSRMHNYFDAALRYERTARQLQRMPTMNIDENLVSWSSEVTDMLRQIANSLRGVPAEMAVQREAARGAQYYGQQPYIDPPMYSPFWNYPWRWGYRVPIQPNAMQRNPLFEARETMTRTIVDEERLRLDIWNQIRDRTEAVRREMSSRYATEFPDLIGLSR